MYECNQSFYSRAKFMIKTVYKQIHTHYLYVGAQWGIIIKV